MHNQKIGFIGIGNMGQAILTGILKKGLFKAENIFLYDPYPEQMQPFKKQGCHLTTSAKELCEQVEMVFLCIKPQKMEEALLSIKSAATCDKLFISIAAGISIEYIQKILGGNHKVIRIMPNTPLLIGMGASALSYKPPVSQSEAQMIENIFGALGVVEILDESKMSAITAVNGSSPAYIYYVIEAMQRFALSQGIDEAQATQLICATVIGAANMVLQSEDKPQRLIEKVTSPGGTTLEAMKVFNRDHMDNIIIEAMERCTQRADELEK
jgi:pyrroline-5-carboxylate reductase